MGVDISNDIVCGVRFKQISLETSATDPKSSDRITNLVAYFCSSHKLDTTYGL